MSTSSSTAIALLCCFAIAVSFCWTMRSLVMDNFSCTFSFDCKKISMSLGTLGSKHTTSDDEGAMLELYCFLIEELQWNDQAKKMPRAVVSAYSAHAR